MFALSEAPLNGQALTESLVNHAAGALVTFEGRVRKTNDGRAVRGLDYELFPELCLSEGEKILAEARQLFGVIEARAVHRHGRLELGEAAVWVGVLSGHRAAAYQASRYTIDAIKARCPIWKREDYVDGPAEWIGCPTCEHHAAIPKQIFAKQEKLVGAEGQKRLSKSRVLIVGAGGLGCPAALHLAAAGVGFLRIVDGDRLEASNLHRQTLYTLHDVGAPKAWLAKRRIEEMHPYSKVEAQARRFSPETAEELLQDIDLLLDCSDNFATKYLLNDQAVARGLPFVQASIYQNQAQILSYRPGLSACLRCESPEQPPASCVDSCTDSGVLGAATGIVGSWQALEAIKTLLGQDSPATEHMLYLDLDLVETMRIPRRQRVDACPACSGELSFDYGEGPTSWQRSYASLDGAEHVWVDIREEHESRPSLPGALRMPLSRMDRSALSGLGASIVLVCERGQRSRRLAEELHAAGFTQFLSLEGGLAAL